jgi:hypothetical protein
MLKSASPNVAAFLLKRAYLSTALRAMAPGAVLGGGLGALTGAAKSEDSPWLAALTGGATGAGLGALGSLLGGVGGAHVGRAGRQFYDKATGTSSGTPLTGEHLSKLKNLPPKALEMAEAVGLNPLGKGLSEQDLMAMLLGSGAGGLLGAGAGGLLGGHLGGNIGS